MVHVFRRVLFAFVLGAAARAEVPAALESALLHLRDQKSYSWEAINGDPGPVAQQFQTRRGTITTIQRNTSPNVKGQIDRHGDMLIEREWSDGLKLETVIAADGTMVTRTPEGWLTDREILSAQAEERLRGEGMTPRQLWLRRADRPNLKRPDEELVPLLRSNARFEFVGDGYVAHLRSRAGDPSRPSEDENEPGTQVAVTMNLQNGVIRDYEVRIEAARRATRARILVPVHEQPLVILTYLPISRIAIPPEAREKLQMARRASGGRPE